MSKYDESKYSSSLSEFWNDCRFRPNLKYFTWYWETERKRNKLPHGCNHKFVFQKSICSGLGLWKCFDCNTYIEREL